MQQPVSDLGHSLTETLLFVETDPFNTLEVVRASPQIARLAFATSRVNFALSLARRQALLA